MCSSLGALLLNINGDDLLHYVPVSRSDWIGFSSTSLPSSAHLNKFTIGNANQRRSERFTEIKMVLEGMEYCSEMGST